MHIATIGEKQTHKPCLNFETSETNAAHLGLSAKNAVTQLILLALRWQYAFKQRYQEALGLPHIMSEMYSWADEMVPYMKPEVIRLNWPRKTALQRYIRAKERIRRNTSRYRS